MSSVDSRPPAPRNVKALATYLVDAIDVHWDDPAWNVGNRTKSTWPSRSNVGAPGSADYSPTLLADFDFTKFQILGHRVYRSAESPDTGFHLISGQFLLSRSYRDRTTIREIHREDVTNRFTTRGDDEHGEWRFIVRNTPISALSSQLRENYNPEDVLVEIAVPQEEHQPPKLVRVPVVRVRGDTGEITINSKQWLDLETNRVKNPLLPDLSANPTSGLVFCSYPYGESLVSLSFHRGYYYRVTTVAKRLTDDLIVETPLVETEVANTIQLDGFDFIWNRANVLNRWLLEQVGEEALFFLRKRSGTLCQCYDSVHKRGRTDCPDCFGTQFVGGYEGPFEALTTPFEGTKNIEFTEMGLTLNTSYEISMLDAFLINSEDILIRKDGQRYVLSNVQHVGPRGTIRVQSATAARLPESDYRQNIPVNPIQTKLSSPLQVDNGRMPGVDRPILVDTTESDRTEVKGARISFGNLMQGR